MQSTACPRKLMVINIPKSKQDQYSTLATERKELIMNKIFVCSPYRGDVKKNLENVKRYCRDVSYDGMPIAPHLYFTQFLDERYDRYKGMSWGKSLLAECKEMRVYADEVSEGMIEEVQEARRLRIPIKFFNADMEEIKYDALIINKRIGIGYKQIIEETVNPGGRHICPYAVSCDKSCTQAEVKRVQAVSEPEGKSVTVDTKGNDWRGKLLAHFNRGH